MWLMCWTACRNSLINASGIFWCMFKHNESPLSSEVIFSGTGSIMGGIKSKDRWWLLLWCLKFGCCLGLKVGNLDGANTWGFLEWGDPKLNQKSIFTNFDEGKVLITFTLKIYNNHCLKPLFEISKWIPVSATTVSSPYFIQSCNELSLISEHETW